MLSNSQDDGLNGNALGLSGFSRELISRTERIEALQQFLPDSAEPYIDKYFLLAKEILEKEGINPWVKAQVMIRKGPGTVGGIDEAIAIISKYSDLQKHGGKVWALDDGDLYSAGEPILMIEGPILDLIGLETMYLGVTSAESTLLTDGVNQVDLDSVTEKMRQIVSAAKGRPVIYMGARHWRYDADAAISAAAFEGGADQCSTDTGAKAAGKLGVGTMPHVLENVFAYYYGSDNAVLEASKAFERRINPEVTRVSLIDYRNHELDDALATAAALKGKLHAVRIDTCGENLGQGALPSADCHEAIMLKRDGVPLIDSTDPDAKYWYGNGVTVSGALAMRRALDQAGYTDVKIVLSSGFASPEKVRAFVRAEELLNIKLFDYLGVGQLFPSRASKMDIVMVGTNSEDMKYISKAGRGFKANPRLKEVPLPQNFAL